MQHDIWNMFIRKSNNRSDSISVQIIAKVMVKTRHLRSSALVAVRMKSISKFNGRKDNFPIEVGSPNLLLKYGRENS